MGRTAKTQENGKTSNHCQPETDDAGVVGVGVGGGAGGFFADCPMLLNAKKGRGETRGVSEGGVAATLWMPGAMWSM